MAAAEPAVKYEVQDGIAVITLNRPNALNSINPEVAVRLQRAYTSIRDDPDVRVAIITGTGRAFCAGADLKRLITLSNGSRDAEDEWDREYLDSTPDPFMRTFDIKKPLIAAVNGFAVAGGMELVQATDIRVSVSGAKFGLQEPKWGLFPLGGSTARLVRQIPKAIAMEILLTGRLLPAERMREAGFVNYVVKGGQAELLEAARGVAQLIAANSPGAVVAIKRSVRECSGQTLDDAMNTELRIGGPVFAQPDAVEGPRAFAEKRKPVWAPVGRSKL